MCFAKGSVSRNENDTKTIVFGIQHLTGDALSFLQNICLAKQANRRQF